MEDLPEIPLPLEGRTTPFVRMTIDGDPFVFSGEQIVKAEVLQEISPLSIELPYSTATITLHLDGQLLDDFSPFSNGRYFNNLFEGLVMDISEGFEDGQEVSVGRFYLDEWENPANGEITFKCTDAIGVLDNIPYDGKFYEHLTSINTIVDDLLFPLGFDYTVQHSDTLPEGTALKGYLPGGENVTVRQALQQILFAAGAFASCEGRTDILVQAVPVPKAAITGTIYYYDDDITYYDDGVSQYSDLVANKLIGSDVKSNEDKLTLMPLVTAVEVNSHDYVKGGEIETIFQADYLPIGDYKIIFSKPYWEVSAVGAGDKTVYLGAADGAVLIAADSASNAWPNVVAFTIPGEFEFGSNHVFLHVVEAGEVIVTGKPWLDTVQTYSYTAPVLTELQTPNVWKIEKATMVNSENVEGVLSRLVDLAKLRYKLVSTLFPQRIELGELVIIQSFYNNQLSAVTKKIRKDLTGGYLLETEFAGIERMDDE